MPDPSANRSLPPRLALVLLGLILVIGLALRWMGIHRSFGHDEIYTLVIFASRSWADILTGYDLPNNHILHTLLLRVSQSMFGESEWSVRLPALLAGVGSLPLLYGFARRLTGVPTVGLLAALLLAVHHLHVSFSHQARGYTLLALLGLLYADALWWSLRQAASSPTAKARHGIWQAMLRQVLPWGSVALAGSLAVLTLPSAILLVGAGTVAALLVVHRQRDSLTGRIQATLAGLGLATGVILIVTALVYLPLHTQLQSHAARFGEPLSILTFPSFLARVADHIGPVRWSWIVQLVSIWGLITLEGARRGAGLFLGGLIGLPLLLNLPLGTQAEPRVYLFLVPFTLTAVATGCESLRRMIAARAEGAGWVRAVAMVPLLLAVVAFSDGRPTVHETGYRDAGRYLTEETADGDLVVVPYIMDSAIGYYTRGGILSRARALPEAGLQRLIFVTRPGTPRFRLNDLMLATNFTTDAAGHRDTHRHIQLPGGAFETLEEFGSTSIRIPRALPFPIDLGPLTNPAAWSLYYATDPQQTTVAETSDPWLLVDPVIEGSAAVLHTRRHVRFGAAGLAVLILTRTGDGYASLYELGDEGPQAVQMVAPLAAPAIRVVETDSLRSDIALVPVQADHRYGLFLTARGPIRTRDWQLYFISFDPNEPREASP